MLIDGKGKELCNFIPRVEGIIDIHSNDKESSDVQLRMEFENEHHSQSFIVPLSKLEQTNWLEYDGRCCFNPDIPYSRINRHLANTIRKELGNVPRKSVYQLNSTGVHIIGEEVMYCAGKEVIRSPSGEISDLNIESQLKNKCLDIDQVLTESQATYEMFELINLSPSTGNIILLFKLIYMMRQAYIDAGARPSFCIFLYGRTGTQKTTFSSFLTQTYNRRQGILSPTRLNASIPAAVELLLEATDDVVILDDLFPAESSLTRKQQEQTLIELTRYVGDGTMPARMKRGRISNGVPKCGVIFTGEYVIGSGSDAARLLPIEMVKPEGEKLKYFQDHPLMVSTFYYFYIVWFIAHYKDIVSFLKEWWDKYRKTDLGINDRLQETHFFFNTAYLLLLQYWYEKKYLLTKDVFKLHSSFVELLTSLVHQQNKRVQQTKSEEVETVDYLGHIRALYKNNILSIASSAMQFNENIHEGVIHNECLCLRGDKLVTYFSGGDIAEIADSLFCQGALKTGKNNRTIQISALNGKRFYAIPLSYLG